jgi:hypothetical protein
MEIFVLSLQLEALSSNAIDMLGKQLPLEISKPPEDVYLSKTFRV